MAGVKAARLRLTSVRGHYVTPEELGKDVGVSGQTIRNYESGESEPSFEMVEKLAGVLGVTLSWPPFGNVPIEPEMIGLPPAKKPKPDFGLAKDDASQERPIVRATSRRKRSAE